MKGSPMWIVVVAALGGLVCGWLAGALWMADEGARERELERVSEVVLTRLNRPAEKLSQAADEIVIMMRKMEEERGQLRAEIQKKDAIIQLLQAQIKELRGALGKSEQ